MELSGVIERVERVARVRADSSECADLASSALVDIRDVRAFLDASEAVFTRRVAQATSFPESAIADASRGSLSGASRTIDRANTLSATPSLAGALDAATVTSGHIDVVTRAVKSLESDQRERLLDKVDSMVTLAETATVAEFGRRVRAEASRIAAEDGMARLERQRRATTLSTWVDAEGMWCLRGRFDPLTGVSLASRLDNTVEALFAEALPDNCPTDPVEKQKHLRALALARLLDRSVGPAKGRPRPEFVAVIDVTAPPGPGPDRPIVASTDHVRNDSDCVSVEWPIPIEIPQRVLADLMDDADIITVIVRNGVVLHAPGELNLGRTTRLANRAQRRALRALYRTCAIPGCSVGYDRCKLHHIIWWRSGGRTDLENLIPVCSRHHHKIHDAGWNITLGPHRELTVSFPDGTVRNTGPPTRRAA